MRNLKVWQKLALMGAVFVVPLALVTYKLTASTSAVGIETARREVRGLAYFVPALALVKDLQLHRDVAHAWLDGNAAFQPALAARRTDVEADVRALDAANQQLDSARQTTERWASVRAECLDLLDATPRLSAEQSFARHAKVIANLMAMVREVGHASSLTSDPDAERKQLVDVLVVQGPELSDSLARARGFGTAAARGKRTADQVESLSREAVLVEFFAARLDDSIAATLESNADLRSRLEEPSRATSAAVMDALGELVRLSREDRASNPTDYFAALSRGVDSIATLETQIGAALNDALTARVVQLRREMLVTLATAICGLLVVSFVGFIIMRDITVTLNEVVGVANAIAVGDLTAPVASRSTSRSDELGVLAQAFGGMVVSLKETVTLAERMAAGDLAVVVTPRSDRDVMGRALAHMVERLSALVGDVQQSGTHVDSSVNQIAAVALQQHATTTEIAATTTEIRATSKQIAVTSHELVKTMNEVSTVAEQSAALAGNGQDGVARMEQTMLHVIEAAGAINTRLTVLNEKAGAITQVVTTITKVADQTNLLSLNAAIEAEKAGEYGRGFAVVATEIRRLADQTAVATYDIGQMVGEIQSAVSASVLGMEKFSEEVRRGIRDVQEVGNQLSQIIQRVQALPPRFQVVNEGMQAQATGAEQITVALSQLGDTIQQTVESLRESNQIIDGLNHAAAGMRSGVARFRVAA
jgi:methyl-accepting chemotaxis protein WspA